MRLSMRLTTSVVPCSVTVARVRRPDLGHVESWGSGWCADLSISTGGYSPDPDRVVSRSRSAPTAAIVIQFVMGQSKRLHPVMHTLRHATQLHPRPSCTPRYSGFDQPVANGSWPLSLRCCWFSQYRLRASTCSFQRRCIVVYSSSV